MRTETRILSAAMYELARTIQSDDGVANSAISEAALRLDEQAIELASLRDLKICRDRYETVRLLNPRQFAELYDKNIKTGIPFDTLVDQMSNAELTRAQLDAERNRDASRRRI